MSAPQALKDIYTDEIKDLWSANDQMIKVVKVMGEKAHDPQLKKSLEKAATGIRQHADELKTLLANAGGEAKKEHCKGMEGLAAEATKHITKEAPERGELLDIVIVAQYQRMSHYGIAGFGTAAAYAKALGKSEDARKLTSIVSDIYKAEEYATQLARHAEEAARAAA
jgi:ferritin-like metal-binding protein YciE